MRKSSGMFFLGLVFVFIGERMITAGPARWLTAFGAALVVAALGLRLSQFLGAQNDKTGDRKSVEKLFLTLIGIGSLGLLFYFLQSDLMSSVLGKNLEHDSPKLAVVLAALYPALIAISIIPLGFAELAYGEVIRAPLIEALRIRDAALSGFGLAFAMIFAFSFYYVASERDKKVDLSYFRTAKPGESSRKIVRTLDQPISVSTWFPPSNEVREEVAGYFDDLKKESKLLEVTAYDHAIDLAKAKELGVSGNGVIVVSRGARKEQLSVGLELEAARSQLRNLDKEVQKRLLQVAKPARTVYLTSGHGERTPNPANDTDKRLTIRDLRELLTQQGYTVKELGAGEGLAADVPNDAAMVLAVGPQKAFFPEEAASIGRYLDRGGRLFLAVDPETGLDWKDLLQPLGLKFTPMMLANDQIYARKTHQQSDRANIATGSYSSHPVATTLGKLGMRAPMVLLGAGWLEELKKEQKPANTTVDFPVRAHPATWNDLNGNFAFDAPAETRKGWELAAAVVRKKPGAKPAEEGRALVLADSDAVGDGVLGNPGNAYFVLDGTKWLLGDEAIAGEVSSEVDVPIQHTQKQDSLWFYGTIFLAPLMVLGIGWLVMRRRPSKKQKEASK